MWALVFIYHNDATYKNSNKLFLLIIVSLYKLEIIWIKTKVNIENVLAVVLSQ